jgi:hypothetical protein
MGRESVGVEEAYRLIREDAPNKADVLGEHARNCGA